jgi:hypothetical protein
VFDRYIEGLIKAGLEADPSDYSKFNGGKKLTGQEIMKLVNGKVISGYVYGDQWLTEFSKDDEITYYWSMFEYKGEKWIENESICTRYERRFDGIKDCGEIFYNPQGNNQDKNEYFLVVDYGIFPFSVDDATDQ